jgi:hypothetical protein
LCFEDGETMTTPPPSPDAETREPDRLDLREMLGSAHDSLWWARQKLQYNDADSLRIALVELRAAEGTIAATIAAAERIKATEAR